MVAAVLLMATHLDAGRRRRRGRDRSPRETHLATVGCQLLQGYHIAVAQAAPDLTRVWRQR